MTRLVEWFVRARCVGRLVKVLQACPSGPVEVLGDDVLAGLLRKRLGARVSPTIVESPTVIIDASGSSERIEDALRRLDDLGTLVLTRKVHGGQASVNPYTDLHFRSLTIIGVN